MLFVTFPSIPVFSLQRSEIKQKKNKKTAKNRNHAWLNVEWERIWSRLLEGRAMSCGHSSWQLPAHFSLFPVLNIQHLSLDPKALSKCSTKYAHGSFTCQGNDAELKGGHGEHEWERIQWGGTWGTGLVTHNTDLWRVASNAHPEDNLPLHPGWKKHTTTNCRKWSKNWQQQKGYHIRASA